MDKEKKEKISKNEEKKNELHDQFNRIQEESKDIDVSKYLATREDLPDLGEIEIYDYDNDEIESRKQAINVIETLADLYLGDMPAMANHPYIQEKMKEDTSVYSEAIFLQKMSRKNFLQQLRQIDNGDNSARMHEVVNQTISQVRENIKFSQSQRTELEKYYKEIRKDYKELIESVEEEIKDNNEEEDDNNGKIIDSRKLNDMVDQLLKDRPENK